jgi:hypothetical protein
MKNTCLILILFLFNPLFSQNILFCGCEQLVGGNKIKKKELKLNKKIEVYKNDNNVKGFNSLEKNIVNLNEEFELVHVFTSLSTKLETMVNIDFDSIYLFGSKFSIQKIVNDSNCVNTEVSKSFFINDRESNFLILEGTLEVEKKSNYYKHWVTIFNITDKSNIFLIKNAENHRTFGFLENYINDFNNDGIIDFCFIENDEIKFYSLINNSLVELKDIYYPLKKIKDYYYINLSNSKYNYILPKNCSKNKLKLKLNKLPNQYIYPADKKW